VRYLNLQLRRCAQERDRTRERLEGLPAALQTLQTRLNDTLLRPIEATLANELAPAPAPRAASSSS
jgi:hypothetical protein